jgi:hypothetical protein
MTNGTTRPRRAVLLELRASRARIVVADEIMDPIRAHTM